MVLSRLLLLDRGEYVKETKIEGMELYWIDLDRQNDDGGSVVLNIADISGSQQPIMMQCDGRKRSKPTIWEYVIADWLQSKMQLQMST
ncbi:hypothetical protein BLOT_000067 [Blomia tropicalis]|nr:hypothetical protein BLOT_000067 [Blomia tropicalis]